MKNNLKNEENNSLIIDSDEYTNENEYEDGYQSFSWFTQIILWLYLLYIFSFKSLNYYIFIIIYCIYFFTNVILSEWTSLLYNAITLNELFTKLFYSPLEIYFYLSKMSNNCFEDFFHFIGINKLNFMEKQKYFFPYYSCRDISGLIILKTPLKNTNIKFLHAKIHVSQYIYDDISRFDYDKQYNKYKKIYMEEKIENNSNGIYAGHNYYLKDYKFYYWYETLIKLDEKSNISYFVNIYFFLFFKIICLGKIYEMFIFRFIHKADKFARRENIIRIRKIISTRYNLSTPEISKKYGKVAPCVNYNGKFYYFDQEKSVYISSNVIPIFPNEKEINKKYGGNMFLMEKNIDDLINKGEEYKSKSNGNDSSDLTADYLIKVNESHDQYTSISLSD